MFKRLLLLFLTVIILVLPACEKNNPNPAETVPGTVELPETPSQTASPEPTAEPPAETPDPNEYKFFHSWFPKTDGSASTKPLVEALAGVLLGETPETIQNLVSFSGMNEAFTNLVNPYVYNYFGIKVSFVVAPEPIWDDIPYYGHGGDNRVDEKLEIAKIAVEGLVFFVSDDNPVSNLTIEQIQKIYSGEITNWSQLGGNDIEISAFLRNENSGSQELMKKLIMRELDFSPSTVDCVFAFDRRFTPTVGARNFDGSASAIGYATYLNAGDIVKNSKTKFLCVDGIAPSKETIASGEYPLTNPYIAAIQKNAKENSPERNLYNWLQTDEAYALIERIGYIPEKGEVKQFSVHTDYNTYFEYTKPEIREIYKVPPSGVKDTLLPSDSYGAIVPYIGEVLAGFYDEHDLYRYGLCTAEGMLITPPVYKGIYQVNQYDTVHRSEACMPVYFLERPLSDKENCELFEYESTLDKWHYEETGEKLYLRDGSYTNKEYAPSTAEYAVCAVNGSWVTNWYYSALFFDKVFILVCVDGSGDVFDYNGNLLYNTASLLLKDNKLDFSERRNWVGREGWLLYTPGSSSKNVIYIEELTGDVQLYKCENASGFQNGYSAVQKNGLWGYIDRDFNLKINYRFLYYGIFYDGFAVCELTEDNYVLIDENGTVIKELTFRKDLGPEYSYNLWRDKYFIDWIAGSNRVRNIYDENGDMIFTLSGREESEFFEETQMIAISKYDFRDVFDYYEIYNASGECVFRKAVFNPHRYD